MMGDWIDIDTWLEKHNEQEDEERTRREFRFYDRMMRETLAWDEQTTLMHRDDNRIKRAKG
jgi:hypothetical protein